MADENQMKNWLAHYSSGGKNVIIFKNGIDAQLGSYEYEMNEELGGERYNIYVGASGDFLNKGDGGWINWAMTGDYEKNGNLVRFR